MDVSADHGATKEEARHTVERELPRLLQRFGGHVSNVRHAWRGDTLEFSFSAVGADIEGLAPRDRPERHSRSRGAAQVPPVSGEN